MVNRACCLSHLFSQAALAPGAVDAGATAPPLLPDPTEEPAAAPAELAPFALRIASSCLQSDTGAGAAEAEEAGDGVLAGGPRAGAACGWLVLPPPDRRAAKAATPVLGFCAGLGCGGAFAVSSSCCAALAAIDLRDPARVADRGGSRGGGAADWAGVPRLGVLVGTTALPLAADGTAAGGRGCAAAAGGASIDPAAVAGLTGLSPRPFKGGEWSGGLAGLCSFPLPIVAENCCCGEGAFCGC